MKSKTNRKADIRALVEYVGRCYRTEVEGTEAYSQITGVIVGSNGPAELPLEITHVLYSQGTVRFRRGAITVDDLGPGMLGTAEIPADQYVEEVQHIMDAFAPLDMPTDEEKERLVELLEGRKA